MSIVRLALFEGAVKPGCEAAFDAYVTETLVPLWTRFPGLGRFQVLRRGQSDDGALPHALVLVFTYPSLAALEEAMASRVRAESREATKGLFEFFEGRIMHIVAEGEELALAAAERSR